MANKKDAPTFQLPIPKASTNKDGTMIRAIVEEETYQLLKELQFKTGLTIPQIVKRGLEFALDNLELVEM